MHTQNNEHRTEQKERHPSSVLRPLWLFFRMQINPTNTEQGDKQCTGEKGAVG